MLPIPISRQETKVLLFTAWLSSLVAVCMLQSLREALISPLCSMPFEVLQVTRICSQQVTEDFTRRRSVARSLSTRSTTTDLNTIANKYYQENVQPREEHSHLVWAQNIGMSFSEYWYDKPCTSTLNLEYCTGSQPNETAKITNYSCGQRPMGRLFSASVSYGRMLGSNGQAITSYFLTFGGINGAILDDMWVFANGLVNGEDTAANLRDIRDPASNFLRSCEDPSASSCSSCNRWHKVRAHAATRAATLCKLQLGGYCDIMAYKNSTVGTFGLTGHAATVVAATQVATVESQGIILSFGGLRRNYGLSGEVWYLSKLPFPILGASEPGYDDLFPPSNREIEWRCADIFGHGEHYPPSPACNGSISLTSSNGTINSGRLRPFTECSWSIAPEYYYNLENGSLENFNTDSHAIQISIDKLDLEAPGRFFSQEQSGNGYCESFISIRDVGGSSIEKESLLVRGCNKKTLTASSFVSTTGQLLVSLHYAEDCPHHSGVALSYKVVNLTDDALYCPEGCSNRGRCQAGVCICDEGRHGAQCQHSCSELKGCNPDMETTSDTDAMFAYPQPRQEHTMVSVLHESMAKQIVSSNIFHEQVSSIESPEIDLRECGSSTNLGDCNPGFSDCCIGYAVLTLKGLSETGSEEFGHLQLYRQLNITNTTILFSCIETSVVTSGSGNVVIQCDKYKKTTVVIESRAQLTNGTTRQILFGGWSGSRALDDLWILDMMEPAASDTATFHDCAVRLDEDGNITGIESPIQDSRILGLDSPFLNVTGNYIAYLPCVDSENPSKPSFPISDRRNRWTRMTPTDSLSAGTSASGMAPIGRFGHSAIVVKTARDRDYRMVIFGGTNGMQTFDDLFSLIIPKNYRVMQGEKINSLKWRNMSDISRNGPWPSKRAEHAASIYFSPNKKTYMAIYGGRHDSKVFNDLWLLPLDIVDGKESRTWIKKSGENGPGSYFSSSLKFPLDIWPSLSRFIAGFGFNYWTTQVERTPPRFGHTMITLESSAALDAWTKQERKTQMDTSQSMLVFSGATATTLVSSKSHTREGLVKGFDAGKDPILFYVCPDADLVCAEPVYKGH